MKFSKDEAICLVLGFSDKNVVSSKTKLNKLLARLNLFFIPIDFSFSLNKFGSFNAELSSLSSNEYYTIEPYEYNSKPCHKYVLKQKGLELIKVKVLKKLGKIMKQAEFNELREEIHGLSMLNANEISNDEHKKLLVDVDERFKLDQKLNEVFIELKDLYADMGEIKEDSLSSIKLRGLIEYSFYLIKYLRERKFKRLDERDYDFDAHMFDYYFLYNISKIIPFIKQQISQTEKDEISINKYYQYLVNSVRDDYPFSIDNHDLKELVV